MYWFPREERIGNGNFWSEYDLEVLELVLIIAARMLWVCCSCLGWMLSRRSLCDRLERRHGWSWCCSCRGEIYIGFHMKRG